MQLRPYQQDAVDAAIQWMKKSTEPALLELATGSGKSHIAAAIAQWIAARGKKVLILQPSKELTEQNAAKYRASGQQCSVFSASAGSKCTRHDAVYATPKSVANSISRFGDAFGAVIVDEAHMTTPTVRDIITHLRSKNPLLRVIGMTATPYRMGSGYIYQCDMADGKNIILDDEKTTDPYYHALLYRITTRELIDMGFLTNAHADPSAVAYDTSEMQLNKMGQFDAAQVERVFEGQGRLTSSIVADVVAHSVGRRGVMLFASTVQHAREILDSLPPVTSRMIGGDINMSKLDREKLINDFKAMRFKHLVSVGTLTTGFDAPHVDVVAVLRATESASLFQQIVGRGLRLAGGKNDCLVLDYAQNIERHKLQNDLFTPEIRAYKSTSGGTLEVECPYCRMINLFTARKNPDKFEMDSEGYFVDLAGNRIITESGQPLPAHMGRRCQGFVPSPIERGKLDRCENRWSFKKCEQCDHENDIAARYCENKDCKAELVDPNEKLRAEFALVAADPHALRTEEVLFFDVRRVTSRNGNDMILCEYTTPTASFKTWNMPNGNSKKAMARWIDLCMTCLGWEADDAHEFIMEYEYQRPETVTFRKQRDSEFFEVIAHNRSLEHKK